jgi:restriction system protein
MKPWKAYQETAATYFQSLGLCATVDCTVKGARTTHEVDVLVRSNHAGFEITWIVECKHWSNPISKLHVLALREIVADVGADKGILLAESGFQRGALEAASLTNVLATSLADMQATAGSTIYSMRLLDLVDRIGRCSDRYWDISKEDRIAIGLRAYALEHDYSGARVIDMTTDLVSRAVRGIFPFESESIEVLRRFGRDKRFVSAKEVVDIVEEEIAKLEGKLDEYERGPAKF